MVPLEYVCLSGLVGIVFELNRHYLRIYPSNMRTSRILIFLALVSFGYVLQAQSFYNGGLEGGAWGDTLLPPGWTAVDYADPVCQSHGQGGDTPDVTGINAPIINVIAGNPYEGNAYMSGLRVVDPGGFPYDEGIQQVVNDFTVGQVYSISFFQNVTRQSNMSDSSGSWAVYVENTLIGVTAPCVDTTAIAGSNHPWFRRGVSFVASMPIHVIKFMPRDDDTIVRDNHGVRMGIDSITLYRGAEFPVAVSSPAVTDFSYTLHGRKLEVTGTSGLLIDIRLFDLQGREVYTRLHGLEADFGDLPAGAYCLQLASVRRPEGRLVRKIFLE